MHDIGIIRVKWELITCKWQITQSKVTIDWKLNQRWMRLDWVIWQLDQS